MISSSPFTDMPNDDVEPTSVVPRNIKDKHGSLGLIDAVAPKRTGPGIGESFLTINRALQAGCSIKKESCSASV